jgi:hypothetical protein
MSESRMTRRAALAAAAAGMAGPPEVDEKSFRYRLETVDALFARARQARSEQRFPFSAYQVMLELLRAEEIRICGQAEAFTFKDITESNYWRRGRLKFPSELQMELRLASEGQDPALKR